MSATKTLREREKELQTLLATPEGRADLEELASHYHDAGGRLRPEGGSLVTYVIIHERERGLIAD